MDMVWVKKEMTQNIKAGAKQRNALPGLPAKNQAKIPGLSRTFFTFFQGFERLNYRTFPGLCWCITFLSENYKACKWIQYRTQWIIVSFELKTHHYLKEQDLQITETYCSNLMCFPDKHNTNFSGKFYVLHLWCDKAYGNWY